MSLDVLKVSFKDGFSFGFLGRVGKRNIEGSHKVVKRFNDWWVELAKGKLVWEIFRIGLNVVKGGEDGKMLG